MTGKEANGQVFLRRAKSLYYARESALFSPTPRESRKGESRTPRKKEEERGKGRSEKKCGRNATRALAVSAELCASWWELENWKMSRKRDGKKKKKITEEAPRAIMPVYLIGYGKEFVSCYFRGYFRALTLKRFARNEESIEPSFRLNRGIKQRVREIHLQRLSWLA